jgi:hypothetical protein
MDIRLTETEQADLDRHVAERGDRFATAYWSARVYGHSHADSIAGARYAVA